MKRYSLVIFYHKNSRNSFRALFGALEKYKLIEEFDFYFPLSFMELENTLNKTIKLYSKSFLLFSLMTPQFIEWKEKLKQIKKKKIIKLAGGPHPSGLPFSLKNMFDFLFYKEAEKSLSEFLINFLSGKNLEKSEGIIYWKNGKMIINRRKEEIDINQFPPFSKTLGKYGPIEITRGCIFGCKYCQTSYLMGKKLRHRKIEIILEWVEELVKKGMRDIRFITPNAFSYGAFNKKELNIQAIYELLSGVRRIIKKDGRIFFGSFPSEVRPDYVNSEIMEIIKEFCNNTNIVIGCQSGSERILELIQREHGLEETVKAVYIVKKFGFTPIVDFIIGLPGEEEKDMEETIAFAEKLIKEGAIIHLHYFMPLPGTPFWKKSGAPLKKNIIKWIGKYSSEGKAFGSLEKQFYFSKKMQRLFNSLNFTL